jgi:hypothetical protein
VPVPRKCMLYNVGRTLTEYVSASTTSPSPKTTPHRCYTLHLPLVILRKYSSAHPSFMCLISQFTTVECSTITVLQSSTLSFRVQHCPSQFDTLKRLLIGGGNLKALTLRASPVSRFTPLDLKDEPVILHFEEHDRFPALEELTLGYKWYHLSMEHCQSRVACMDWSKLRKSDLEPGMPPHLLSTLIGHVTQSKILRFGVWSDPHNASPTWNCTDFSITKRLLQSINGLEHIAIWS